MQRYGVLLAAVLLAGCVNSHRREYVYSPAYSPAPVLTPTGPSSARVYPEVPPPPPPTLPPPTTVAPEQSSVTTSSSDVAIAESVRGVLRNDLTSPMRRVEASVYHGVVTLRGSVPSDSDRQAIVARVNRLPGVLRVDDQLMADNR